MESPHSRQWTTVTWQKTSANLHSNHEVQTAKLKANKQTLKQSFDPRIKKAKIEIGLCLSAWSEHTKGRDSVDRLETITKHTRIHTYAYRTYQTIYPISQSVPRRPTNNSTIIYRSNTSSTDQTFWSDHIKRWWHILELTGVWSMVKERSRNSVCWFNCESN